MQSSLCDYIVSVFAGSNLFSIKLSELVSRSGNKDFCLSLGFPKDFKSTFYAETNNLIDDEIGFYIKSDTMEYKIIVGENTCYQHKIQHGDYLSIKNNNDETVLKFLFIKTSEIKPGFIKIPLQKDKNYFIGRSENNDISFEFSNYVAREKHIAIRVDNSNQVFVEDLKRTTGVYVNGEQTHSEKLKEFDEVFFMGLSLVLCDKFLAVRQLKTKSTLPIIETINAKMPAPKAEKTYFVRTPRIIKSLDISTVEIDPPPQPISPDKTPAILVLGPSLTMSVVMLASVGVSLTNALNGGNMSSVIASGTMAVGMLAGTLLWPALLRSYQKRIAAKEEKYRRKKYADYISEIDLNLSAKNERNARILSENFLPSPDELLKLLDSEVSRLKLWERDYDDTDFLSIRLGIGNAPSRIDIKTPKQSFQLHDDDLRRYPDQVSENHAYLKNTPIAIDLKNNLVVGVIGDKSRVYDVIYSIVLNTITLQSNEDVKIAVICSEKEQNKFDFLSNVPHIWSGDKKARFFASNHDEVHFVFNAIDEIVKDRENSRESDTKSKKTPHFIILITDDHLIEGEPLLRYLEDADNKVGITTLFAFGDITKIPKACKTIIQTDETKCGYYSKNKNNNKFIEYTPDRIDLNSFSVFSSNLSCLPIKVDIRALSVPDRVTFMQLFKAGNTEELEIEKHWSNNNSSKSLATPIGVMAGGEQFLLDIHEAYHGCHGLVAGTTGSGKSEFLQAFILSLSINFSPNEVAFVLVDFKGGDMARPFMAKRNVEGEIIKPALPHLAATISNLSGNLLYRALVSFNAEIKYRQRLFNESAALLGIDKLDINSYHKYIKSGRLTVPLPHLIIIIDEFAQLKTQQPGFLAELINVAQVGRSLGIHLILATQKPSGVVDPQIWSNSRFKVCLKVAEKQDSIDMIGKPDSALIKNPGRCYVQVGYDEIYECVQSGYSGADYTPTTTYMPDEEITLHMTDNTATPIHSKKLDISYEKTDRTQLESVVADIISLGQKKAISAKPLWKDPLTEKLFLKDLQKSKKNLLKSTIALADFVRVQEQIPLDIDFEKTGHIAVYGASGTGKTTFLQTLVYSLVSTYAYTPDELNIYAMDFGGRSLNYLKTLPHVGDVVFEDNEEKISALADLLQGVIDERKRLFSAHNCGSFVDFNNTGNKRVPAILVIIDNYAPLREKYMDISERFLSIISSGKTFGVYFAITGSTRNSIYYKVTEQISTYFTLKMNDTANYFDILNVRPPIYPEDIKGRGITVINKEVVEFQVALVGNADTESERISSILTEYQQFSANWKGSLPIPLTVEIDDNYAEVQIPTQYVSANAENPPDIISDNENSLPVGTSLSGASLYGLDLTISYKLIVCAKQENDLFETYKRIIFNITKHQNRKITVIDDSECRFSALSSLESIKYISGSDTLSVYFESLKSELNERLENPEAEKVKLFILITDYNDFFDMITDEQADMMRRITKFINEPKFGVYFICGFNVNNDKSNDRLFIDLVVNAEDKLICPDSYKVGETKLEKFPIIRDIKKTDAYFCHNEQYVKIRV